MARQLIGLCVELRICQHPTLKIYGHTIWIGARPTFEEFMHASPLIEGKRGAIPLRQYSLANRRTQYPQLTHRRYALTDDRLQQLVVCVTYALQFPELENLRIGAALNFKRVGFHSVGQSYRQVVDGTRG